MMTCKWCGKQFNYDPFTRGSHSTAYCCGRCYNAAMREKHKEDEKSEQFLKDHPFAILIIIGIIVVISIIPNNSGQKTSEEDQESTVTLSNSSEKNVDQTFIESGRKIEIDAETFIPDKTNKTEANDETNDKNREYEILCNQIEKQVIADYKSQKIWNRETPDLQSAFLATYAAETASGYLYLDGDVYYHTQDEIDLNSLKTTVQVKLLDENHAHVFVKLNDEEQPSLLVMVRDRINEVWLVDDIRDAQNTNSLKEGMYEFASKYRDESRVDDKKEINENDKKEIKDKKKQERKEKRDKKRQERAERKHGKNE